MLTRLPSQRIHNPVAESVGEIIAWAATARCVISFLYKHRLDWSNIICDSCYLEIPPEGQALYAYRTRHYMHIGIISRYETCTLCQTILGSPRPCRDCETCTGILPNFLRYLNQAGEAPHLEDEAIIVAISEEPGIALAA